MPRPPLSYDVLHRLVVNVAAHPGTRHRVSEHHDGQHQRHALQDVDVAAGERDLRRRPLATEEVATKGAAEPRKAGVCIYMRGQHRWGHDGHGP